MRVRRGSRDVPVSAAVAVTCSLGGATLAPRAATTTPAEHRPCHSKGHLDLRDPLQRQRQEDAAREKLIQNAPHYKAVFVKLFNSKVAKSNPTVAKVTAVTFPSASDCRAAVKTTTCAKVAYDLETATTGSPLLTDQTGYAVYVKGHWLCGRHVVLRPRQAWRGELLNR